MTDDLSVIIVSYNTRDDLSRCLASIFAHPPARLRSVVVVDNASTDGSVDLVRTTWPAVQLIALERNVGFGPANNVGIRATKAPLVLFLNSDSVVLAGALDTLIERLEATGAAAAGPRLQDRQGAPEVSFGSMLSPAAEFRQRRLARAAASDSPSARQRIERLLAEEREVDWVSGACLLARREALIEAGLFDERYFLYEEDVDLCAALRARGGRVLFTPRAQVVHLRGRSSVSATGAARAHYDRSHVAFYEKHSPGWAPWLRLWLRLRGRRIR
jgi:GT2 family glycosyltransferase